MEDIKYALVPCTTRALRTTPMVERAQTPHAAASAPIGINRNGQLAVLQLRPYAPEECKAPAVGCVWLEPV